MKCTITAHFRNNCNTYNDIYGKYLSKSYDLYSLVHRLYYGNQNFNIPTDNYAFSSSLSILIISCYITYVMRASGIY